MSRTTTLRQLIYTATKEALKREGLLRTEIHELVEYILNNSSLKLTVEEIEIVRGNYMGIGKESKDRTITIPRFIIYSFSRQDVYGTLEGKDRTWKLKSFISFDALENALGYYREEDNVAVIIDGEVVGFELRPNAAYSFGGWNKDIKWDREVYSVKYILDEDYKEERFKNKLSLENWVKVLVKRGAEEIEVRNLMDSIHLGFTVSGTLYDSNNMDNRGMWLLWQEQKQDEYDDEEDEMSF